MKKTLITILIISVSQLIFAQPTSWKIRGIGGGGAFFTPSINPGNTSEYYVPTDMGVFFHTTDYGHNYTELGFLQLTGGSGGVIRFTNNSNILYAIGGNGTVNLTTNGGTSWAVIPCIATSSDAHVLESVVSLFVDYNNPLELAFATRDGLYFSNDGGNTLIDITQPTPAYQYIGGCLFTGDSIFMGTPGGVLISTNGGTSFTKAALTGLVAGYDIVGFAAAKQGSTIRFFCSTFPTGTPVDEIYGNVAWQTTYLNNMYKIDFNSSTTWTACSSGITLPSSPTCYPCDYVVWLGMANNDTNTVYAGGTNGSGQPEVLKTSDGGISWSADFLINNNQNIYTGYLGYKGDRFQWWDGFTGMEVCQNNSQRVIISNLGSVHATSDGGTTWQQAYVDSADQNPMNSPTPDNKFYHGIGLECTGNWLVTWVDSNNMVFGEDDLGSLRSSDAGVNWQCSKFSYNTLYSVVKNSGILYGATSDVHQMYLQNLKDQQIDNVPYSKGEVMSSADNGYTWTTIHNFARPVYWLALDKKTPNKMYASVVNHAQGLGGIYVTNDLNDGPSSVWTKLPSPPRTEGHPGSMVTLNDGKMVCTFGPRITDDTSAVPHKFTRSSGVFIYDPVKNSWSDVTDTASYNPITGTYGTMGWYCNDIYVDPNDVYDSTWYVGVSAGWGWTDASGNETPNDQGALMKTTNRGKTWVSILNESNGISTWGGVYSATINPLNPNQLFVSTIQDGLWVSSNINSPNPILTQVSSFQFFFPTRIFFNPYKTNEMWVATSGNGDHVGENIPLGLPDIAERESSVQIYPNPNAGRFTLMSVTALTNSSVEIYNTLGERINTIKLKANKARLDLMNYADGVYLYRVLTETGNLLGEGKFIIQK